MKLSMFIKREAGDLLQNFFRWLFKHRSCLSEFAVDALFAEASTRLFKSRVGLRKVSRVPRVLPSPKNCTFPAGFEKFTLSSSVSQVLLVSLEILRQNRSKTCS